MSEQGEGSRQILKAPELMNNSSAEVRNAAKEMGIGNQTILEEMSRLETISASVEGSMNEMAAGAEEITRSSLEVSDLAIDNRNTVGKLKELTGKFKV